MGKLIFRFGTMTAGKSLNLLSTSFNYRTDGKANVWILKPSIDTRDGDMVKTRLSEALSEACTLIPKNQSILDFLKKEEKERGSIDVILVDEAQFLTASQAKELSFIAHYLSKMVIAYGLKIDFLGNPFEGSSILMAHASNIEEIKTICGCCGKKKAIFHLLEIDGEIIKEAENGTHIEDGETKYSVLCGECYFKKMKN